MDLLIDLEVTDIQKSFDKNNINMKDLQILTFFIIEFQLSINAQIVW